MRRQGLDALADIEPARRRLHHECAKRAIAFVRQAGEYYIEVRDPRVGDERLLTIEHPAARLPPGSRLHRGHVRAGRGFRQRERGDLLTATNARQVAPLLRIRAEHRDRSCAESLHGEHEVRERLELRERLATEAQGPDVELVLRAAVRARNTVFEPSARTQLFRELAAHRIDIRLRCRRAERAAENITGARGGRRRELSFCPQAQIPRELVVPVLEERPAQMLVQAQFPSNVGVFFATNARYARSKSPVCMQIACVCASASIASSMLMLHSWCSASFVIACASVGPSASDFAIDCASLSTISGAQTLL